MHLYELALPVRDNRGRPFDLQHDIFRADMLGAAGGYTELPVARGVWRGDDGCTYRSEMRAYRIACEHPLTFAQLIARAFDLFDDQVALFYAEIGTATIISWEDHNAKCA